MLNETAYTLGSKRSVIRDLFEYGKARAAVVGPENVFDYSIGNPSIPSPPEVNETIRQVLADTDSLLVHGYTSAVGDFDTRKAISDDLNKRYAIQTRPEDFFIGCGAAPELVAVFHALSVPKGEVVAIAPYFPEYKPFVEGSGMKLKVVPPDEGSFQINFEALSKAITYDTQAIIINSPNNPSGVVYTAETLKKLSRLISDKVIDYGHTIYIVSDEPYRELAYGVEVPWLPSIWSDTIVCYSYSKSLSLPGERIGYIYVPENCTRSSHLYAAIAGAARSCGHVCAPSLWQKVIARCTHLRPDLEAYDRNRKTLYEALTSYGYELAKPDGAFYLFIKAPGGDSIAFGDMAKDRDLLIVPGEGFGCPGWFRICYCVSEEQIRRSLPVFKALIEEMQN